jgi:hypothetical protein
MFPVFLFFSFSYCNILVVFDALCIISIFMWFGFIMLQRSTDLQDQALKFYI